MAEAHSGVSTFKATVGAFSILGVVFSIAWTVYTHRPQNDGGPVLQGRAALLFQRLRKKDMELKKAREQARRLEQELSSFQQKNNCELSADQEPQSLTLGKRGRFENVSTRADAVQVVSVTEGRVAWRKPDDKPKKLKAEGGQPHRGVLENGSCTTLEGPVALGALPVNGAKTRAKVIVWVVR